MLRALGHVAAVVHSEFEGAVGARAGEVSVAVTAKKKEEVQKLRPILAAGLAHAEVVAW